MSNEKGKTARCLCGAVEMTVEHPADHVEACHCSMCRRWGGGPLLAVDCGSRVTLRGDDTIARFDSSAWAERGFCKRCGSHLFYRLKPQDRYIVPAGLFEDLGEPPLTGEIFIDEKPAYYGFAQDTKKRTGAEVFAEFAPPE